MREGKLARLGSFTVLTDRGDLLGWGNIPARSLVHIFRIKVEVVAQPALFCREPISPHITCYFFRRATEMNSFSAEVIVTEAWQK